MRFYYRRDDLAPYIPFLVLELLYNRISLLQQNENSTEFLIVMVEHESKVNAICNINLLISILTSFHSCCNIIDKKTHWNKIIDISISA